MKRRNVIKGLSLLPLGGIAGSMLPESVFADHMITKFDFYKDSGLAGAVEGPLTPGPRIYQSIGVEPVINCKGTLTLIGGSIERPEVREAMDAASQHFVQYDELAEGVGKRLAELTKAEWGMVSSGCAGVLKMVTLACVAGGNPEKLHMVPDLSKLEKNEVIIPADSWSAYDFAIQNVGVKIIRPQNLKEFQEALSTKTAFIKLSSGNLLQGNALDLETVVRLAKPWGIPVLADAAAEILTIPSVHLQRGATMVAYSGGKAICGPQCAGLLLGPKNILMSAWQASSPHHGPGRDNKVGREEMLGMLAAVETWVKMDHAAVERKWTSWMNNIAARVSGIESVKAVVSEASGLGNRSPGVVISWDPAKLHITGEDVVEELIHNRPRITLNGGRGTDPNTTSISIRAFQMQEGQDKIVGDRVFEILSKKRSPKPATAMKAPAANIDGHWDMTVDFFSSQSKHSLYLEQDGNWLKGMHKADFSMREISGTIEGTEVKLLSPARRPAVSFIFQGNLSGDTLTGKIDMGEFLTANFTAKRNTTATARVPIVWPSTRPMGN